MPSLQPQNKLLYILDNRKEKPYRKGEEMIEITLIFMALAAGYAIRVLIDDYQYKKKWRERHERDT